MKPNSKSVKALKQVLNGESSAFILVATGINNAPDDSEIALSGDISNIFQMTAQIIDDVASDAPENIKHAYLDSLDLVIKRAKYNGQ